MKVTVYTKNKCQACNLTKRKLDSLKIDYEVINVDEDQNAAELLKSKNIKSAPVVAINDFERFWIGFKPDNINKLAEGK